MMSQTSVTRTKNPDPLLADPFTNIRRPIVTANEAQQEAEKRRNMNDGMNVPMRQSEWFFSPGYGTVGVRYYPEDTIRIINVNYPHFGKAEEVQDWVSVGFEAAFCSPAAHPVEAVDGERREFSFRSGCSYVWKVTVDREVVDGAIVRYENGAVVIGLTSPPQKGRELLLWNIDPGKVGCRMGGDMPPDDPDRGRLMAVAGFGPLRNPYVILKAPGGQGLFQAPLSQIEVFYDEEGLQQVLASEGHVTLP